MKQPWLSSAKFDLPFILGPAWLACLIAYLLHQYLPGSEITPLVWLLLIVGVDVSHVYSTIFRTYLNPQEFSKRRNLYILTPALSLVFSILLYNYNSTVFWRLLAYLAVFHFVRQQFGFMMLYGRNESHNNLFKKIDKIAIYSATLFPILIWHLSGQKKFNWFIPGDFVYFSSSSLLKLSIFSYLIILTLYILKELIIFCKFQSFNIPKNLLFLGTAFSWYFGIVLTNSDIIFTATNVISHGIPYIALIYLFKKNESQIAPKTPFSFLFKKSGIIIFCLFLFIIGYIEEGFWDGLIWREHQILFSWFSVLPEVRHHLWLSILIPLLSLPQVTHYILDAFIWKFKDGDPEWKKTMFLK